MSQWSDLLWWQSEKKHQVTFDISHSDYLPHYNLWYRALDETPFDDVKCVILGQDPYHTPGVPNGLAFSTNPDVRPLPPSLRNIFTEYHNDLGFPIPYHGDLSLWAKHGVLLLNTALTVEPHKPGSHSGYWTEFTEEVVKKLNDERSNLVFILWGRHAQGYHPFISAKRHHVIRSPHPSPLSARTGFFGSKPFSRTNIFLKSKGLEPVDWRLR